MKTFSGQAPITMLILTDFSSTAFNALGYAVSLCQQLETSRIILYHSYQYIPSPFAPFTLLPVYSHQDSLQRLTELKHQIEHLLPENTTIELISDELPLTRAVHELAAQEQIGLVVMGIKGQGNLDQVLFGSNTIEIAKECSVPLLIVPFKAEFDRIEKAVFACDLKKVTATTPVEAISTFIRKLKAKLFILNVRIEEPDGHPVADRELADLHKLWDGEKPVYYYTPDQDIATGIAEFAGEHQTQLIITVPKAHGFFDSIFHHSVTKRLAHHTHLPLLLFNEMIKEQLSDD
jgi:nucleotide-binding universal stress UspA family protein